jgi:hypothetical protein
MMMSNIQRQKANAIQNGQLINADDLNVEFDQLVNKANELDDAIYQNKTLTGNKVFNGATAFQQSVSMNGSLTLEGAELKQSQQHHWAGDETGSNADIFQVDPDYAPTPLTDGYTVVFKVSGKPTATGTLSVAVGSNAALPLFKTSGGRVTGGHVADGELIVAKKLGDRFIHMNAERLPTRYMNVPIPEYFNGTTLRMTGWAAMKSADGREDIEFFLPSSTVISTSTVGLNGLVSGPVSSSVWYYLKGAKSVDGTQAGYVLDTQLYDDNNITMNGVEYMVRRLPIAFRTQANGQMIPFTVTGGWPYQPRIEYTTGLTGFQQAATPTGTEVDLRVLIAGTASTNTLVTCGALIPPTARVAHLCISGEGSQGTLHLTTPHDGTGNRGQTFWNNPSLEANHYETTLLTDGARRFTYRSVGGAWYVTVRGYTTTLL